MREGVLLAEESPSQLMLAHNCSNLEQAFLELSQKQTSSVIHTNNDNKVKHMSDFIEIALVYEFWTVLNQNRYYSNYLFLLYKKIHLNFKFVQYKII